MLFTPRWQVRAQMETIKKMNKFDAQHSDVLGTIESCRLSGVASESLWQNRTPNKLYHSFGSEQCALCDAHRTSHGTSRMRKCELKRDNDVESQNLAVDTHQCRQLLAVCHYCTPRNRLSGTTFLLFFSHRNDFHYLFRKWMSCFKLLLRCASHLLRWKLKVYESLYAWAIESRCIRVACERAMETLHKMNDCTWKTVQNEIVDIEMFFMVNWILRFAISHSLRHRVRPNNHSIHLWLSRLALSLLRHVDTWQLAVYERCVNSKQMYSIHWI